MCGIAGLVRWQGLHDADLTAVCSKVRQLRHRGPDASRCEAVGAQAVLGAARLAIVDKAHSGQPIWHRERQLAMVFNGQIYNFQELRQRLCGQGVSFSTSGDGEVLVQGYALEGVRFFDRLDGMFAFAIWDEQRRQLLLGRDRYGIKPLYVSFAPGQVRFASEIAPLAMGMGGTALRPEAIGDYLFCRFSLDCAFEGIERIAPGEVLIVDSNTLRRQHLVEPAAEGESSLVTCLEQAVASTAQSDEPVGLLLSGGIDSSSLAAVQRPGQICAAYTASYPEGGKADESSVAQETANRLGLVLKKVHVPPDSVLCLLQQAIRSCEEPNFSPIIVTTLALAAASSRDCRVVLSGEGSDELFCSYPRMIDSFRSGSGNGGWVDHYFSSLGWLPTELFPATLAAHGARGAGLRQRIAQLAEEARSPGECIRAFELQQKLPHYHLQRVDRLFMAFGVEARVPYLRDAIVHWGLRQPADALLADEVAKRALRDAVRDRLPGLVTGRRKQSFSAPVAAWLGTSLRECARDTLLGTSHHQALGVDRREVEALFELFAHDQEAYAKPLWGLVCLFLWFDMARSIAAGLPDRMESP